MAAGEDVMSEATYLRLTDDTDYDRVWRWHCRLPERFGQRCRVLVRGAMNSCLVEFTDGFRVVTSRWYVKMPKELGNEAAKSA
jgi:hypothetical protein